MILTRMYNMHTTNPNQNLYLYTQTHTHTQRFSTVPKVLTSL
jgi:hypothetical protein